MAMGRGEVECASSESSPCGNEICGMMTCCCVGGGDDKFAKGGTSSSINSNASFLPTSLLTPLSLSILFPTTTQQYSCTSPSSTGALSLKSFHHFLSACMDSGEVTSKINSAASAPRKNADERLEKRSWPAVSQICNVTDSSGFRGCGTVFVMKSAPIVALYPVEKRPEMYFPLRLVLPTPEAPITTSFIVGIDDTERRRRRAQPHIVTSHPA